MTASVSPHPVDHLVLPVSNLDVSRERLGKLGFTVAADGRHPFGTNNACVFLSDNTYLEPLAIANQDECEAAAANGNVFVARDQAFRFRCGDDGFSGIGFGTADAAVDHARFISDAVSGGDMLEFFRPSRMPDGTEFSAGFKLAFAADLRSPDFFFFCCQRVNPVPSDRSPLETHFNGVLGISEVVLCEPEPRTFEAFLKSASGGADVMRHAFGITAQAANCRIIILTPEGMEAFFDLSPVTEGRGLRGKAIVFKIRDLGVTEAHLAANGVTYTRKNNRILVKPTPGQGALFAFEEIS
ncbi:MULTISPECIES: VOC family protein [unclassified Sinorhizobium]|uniref:VOC family protein n=1 Tax=unclassified Sinorhizobium TaxID=2613772 RepID=UPI0035244E17